MKKYFIKVWGKFFSREYHNSISSRTNWIAINMESNKRIAGVLGDSKIHEVIDGSTKKELLEYLDENVAKSDRKYWKAYKWIKSANKVEYPI